MQVADSAADIRVNRTKTYLYHHHAYDYLYALRMHARIGGQTCSRLLLLMFLLYVVSGKTQKSRCSSTLLCRVLLSAVCVVYCGEGIVGGLNSHRAS